MSNYYLGKLQTRLSCLRDLSARRDQAKRPSEWLMTTLGLAASEAGDLQGAIDWLERGVKLSRDINGADHPRTLEMRAYLCNGLDELGDYGRAESECQDALDKLEKVAPDDADLLARLQYYLAQTEVDMGKGDVAKPLLEQVAQSSSAELKTEAHDRLAELAGQKGDKAAAVKQLRDDLNSTIAQFADFNPKHPDIIAARRELADGELDAGQIQDAIAELAQADGDVDETESSPIEIAELRYDRARAVAKSDPALARKLAQEASDLYAKSAPDTARFRDRRGEIDKLVASLPK
jgi:hypothetical protein